jgi:hypothetical protein|tara:strand:- start:2647 stop:2883 length:237 start_codon:yes stop_codon:yes gene_type:complete
MPKLYNYKLTIQSDNNINEYNLVNIQSILKDERFSHLGFTKNKMYYLVNSNGARKLFDNEIVTLTRTKVDLEKCLIEN